VQTDARKGSKSLKGKPRPGEVRAGRCAAEVALERGNEERPYHRGNGCREEKKTEIGKHALLDVVSQVFFNALREERALKGIYRARNERDDGLSLRSPNEVVGRPL